MKVEIPMKAVPPNQSPSLDGLGFKGEMEEEPRPYMCPLGPCQALIHLVVGADRSARLPLAGVVHRNAGAQLHRRPHTRPARMNDGVPGSLPLSGRRFSFAAAPSPGPMGTGHPVGGLLKVCLCLDTCLSSI